MDEQFREIPKAGEWRRITLQFPTDASLLYRGKFLHEFGQPHLYAALPDILTAEEMQGMTRTVEITFTPYELHQFLVENGADPISWEDYVMLALSDRTPSAWKQKRDMERLLSAVNTDDFELEALE